MSKHYITQSDLNKYLAQIETKLSTIYPAQEAKAITEIVRNDAQDFISRYPACTVIELKNYINNIDFMSDWIQNTEIAEIINKIDLPTTQKRGGILIFLVAVLFVLLFFFTNLTESLIGDYYFDNVKTIKIVH